MYKLNHFAKVPGNQHTIVNQLCFNNKLKIFEKESCLLGFVFFCQEYVLSPEPETFFCREYFPSLNFNEQSQPCFNLESK